MQEPQPLELDVGGGEDEVPWASTADGGESGRYEEGRREWICDPRPKAWTRALTHAAAASFPSASFWRSLVDRVCLEVDICGKCRGGVALDGSVKGGVMHRKREEGA